MLGKKCSIPLHWQIYLLRHLEAQIRIQSFLSPWILSDGTWQHGTVSPIPGPQLWTPLSTSDLLLDSVATALKPLPLYGLSR